jgi:hypothetical protein
VDTEDAVVDKSGKRQVVEDLRAVAPDIHRPILAQTLVVKTVHLRDLARFVVTSD